LLSLIQLCQSEKKAKSAVCSLKKVAHKGISLATSVNPERLRGESIPHSHLGLVANTSRRHAHFIITESLGGFVSHLKAGKSFGPSTTTFVPDFAENININFLHGRVARKVGNFLQAISVCAASVPESYHGNGTGGGGRGEKANLPQIAIALNLSLVPAPRTQTRAEIYFSKHANNPRFAHANEKYP
jgi:hypothetical protein